jgi:NAD(P)H-hydrate repair Nnr-like enzyme with NAD(P)H-hydrate dehydratase domain
MDPISNANRIAMLLRQRLQEKSRSGSVERGGRKDLRGAGDTAGKSAVQSADAIENLDDRKLKRALIENILADQLGAGLINDARFQQVVDQVTETIDADGDGGTLLARAIADLRGGPRP